MMVPLLCVSGAVLTSYVYSLWLSRFSHAPETFSGSLWGSECSSKEPSPKWGAREGKQPPQEGKAGGSAVVRLEYSEADRRL